MNSEINPRSYYVLPEGKGKRPGRNLRPILDLARRSAVKHVGVHELSDGGATLVVSFHGGALAVSRFESFAICCDWVRRRRSWSGPRSIHEVQRVG